MIEIPKQLWNPDFRFIKLLEKEKKPVGKEGEEGWKKNNYPYDSEDILGHMRNNGNYGVIGGYGNLVIVDFDNKTLQETLTPKLPKTFTVQASEFKHLYYTTDKTPKSFKILDKDRNTLADIQGEGKYIVGANSIHPSGKVYTVVDDSPIAFINYAELEAIFDPWRQKRDEQPARQTLRIPNPVRDEIKSKIKVPDLLRDLGVNTNRNPTGCFLHSSKGGKCLSFTDELWHCFHCESEGDIFNLWQIAKNIDFKTALAELAEKAGVKQTPYVKITPPDTTTYILDDEQLNIGTGKYIINNAQGIQRLNKKINKKTDELEMTTTQLHAWHISEVVCITNPYQDSIYKLTLTNEEDSKTFEGDILTIKEEISNSIGCTDSRGIKEAIPALLNYYIQNRIAEIKEEILINAWGCYLNDNTPKQKQVYNHTKLKENVTQEELKEGLQALFNILEKYGKKNKEYKEKLLIYYQLGLVMPFGYIRKQKGLLAPFLIVLGRSGTGKSLTGFLILSTWGVFNNKDCSVSGASINSPYQFGKRIASSTFPLQVDEARQLLQKLSEGQEETEMLKVSIESVGTVRERKGSSFQGYRCPFLTANYSFEHTSDALKVKSIILEFGHDFTHTNTERAEIIKDLKQAENQLTAIGGWLLTKILSKDEKYYIALMEEEYACAGERLLNLLLKDAGLDYKTSTYIKEEQKSEESFINQLTDYIRDTIFSRARQSIIRGTMDNPPTLYFDDAFDYMLSSGNKPNWFVYLPSKQEVVISSTIQEEMKTKFKTNYEYGLFESTVKGLCLNWDRRTMRIGNKFTTRNGWFIKRDDFIRMIRPDEEDNSNTQS